jgi:undecaprenyl-phosphate 4-deoxy-4-formamido-L-arabinose transferase
MNVSVVVPVYNSSQTLPALVARLRSVLHAVCDEYEILLVNDCSKDNSWQVITELMEQGLCYGIDLMRNYGQHNALLCGIRAARYEYVVTMDDDLQNPPEEIPKLLERLQPGIDVVYGIPLRLKHSGWRNFATTFIKRAIQLSMGVSSAVDINTFRAFRTNIREAFDRNASPNICIDVLLSWGTTRFASVKVNHAEREMGKSNYNVFKLVTHALNLLTGFSTVPLRFATWTGFLCIAFGMVLFAYVILRYMLQGTPVPGFPFLASIIVIFSGTQLLVLGIVGEYIGRIFVRNMERPQYVIRRMATNKTDTIDREIPCITLQTAARGPEAVAPMANSPSLQERSK